MFKKLDFVNFSKECEKIVYLIREDVLYLTQLFSQCGIPWDENNMQNDCIGTWNTILLCVDGHTTGMCGAGVYIFVYCW